MWKVCNRVGARTSGLAERDDAYASHMPAATAAPLPPELPPAERRSRACQSTSLDGCWYGLTTGPWIEWTFKDLQKQDLVDEGLLGVMKAQKARKRDDSYPMPNSSQFVFPMIVAPDAFSRRTTVASKGDWKSFWSNGICKEEEKSTRQPQHRGARGRASIPESLPRSMAEEHVVGIFLVHMLSLTATVVPLNGPRGTGAASSGATYTSAFTLAFFFKTASRHEGCIAVVLRKRKREESL